jgi:lipoate-protein ligase A
LNYTFISTRGDAPALDFEFFTRPIRNALAQLGVECEIGTRNDIECQRGKFSGNAQHFENGRILHHGTLLFDSDFKVMEAVLRVDKEKLEYRAVKSCRSRVVNLSELIKEKITLSEFLSNIEQSVCRGLGAIAELPPSEGEIAPLYHRNKTKEWLFSEGRFLTDYSVERKKKYPFGLVKVQLRLEAGLIRHIAFSGDFFSTLPIERLEAALIGKNPNRLDEVDPSPYIHGMRFAELSELLAQ